jgi:aspartokinase
MVHLAKLNPRGVRRPRRCVSESISCLTRKGAYGEATRPLPRVARFAMDLARSRKELLVENALLRRQLSAASRNVEREALDHIVTLGERCSRSVLSEYVRDHERRRAAGG